MNIVLVSSDSALRRLCGDILRTFVNPWQLSVASPEDCPPDGDFYIWDNPAGMELPTRLERPAKHLFLVNRNEVSSFYQGLGGAEANILLKPVTRASLSAFLGMAVSAFHERLSTTTSLRADRDEILQCLIQSNLKLQEYDQDRTNFLARAVHDFRAPLTATCGYCGLLLSEALGPVNDDQKEVLRRMQHSIKRLSRMASAMFELSVGRQVKRKPDLREADIRDCVEQALHEVTPFADGKRIAVTVDLETPPAPLHIEPGQIEQVIVNLLDNACKFTPRGGAIDIRGYSYFWERRALRHSSLPEGERRNQNSRVVNSYRIDIRDSGPQIPWEHLESIFEEYTSYAGGQDRSGGGLGLAICRMMVTQHEGRVWGENTDHGPRFSFVLPLHSTGAGKTELREAGAAQLSGVV